MAWIDYVRVITSGATDAQVGESIGVSGSTVGRWAKGGGVDPGQAAKLARIHGRPVLEAFIAAGFLTEEEAKARVVLSKPENLSHDELIAELVRRHRADQLEIERLSVRIDESRPGGRFAEPYDDQPTPVERLQELHDAMAAVADRPLRKLPPPGPLRDIADQVDASSMEALGEGADEPTR